MIATSIIALPLLLLVLLLLSSTPPTTAQTTNNTTCQRNCTEIESQIGPVCGTNNVTFPSICALTNAACTNTTLKIAYNATCHPLGPECATWACPAIWAPVCGSDGKEYANGCELGYNSKCKGLNVTATSKDGEGCKGKVGSGAGGGLRADVVGGRGYVVVAGVVVVFGLWGVVV
ncbi:hypothetical protein HDV05_005487 [Chytridiales sp. JEL 0842]|nr:hypothetical protein HDV05_005487 [Chytridiales sp. JEL 0842]